LGNNKFAHYQFFGYNTND